MAALGSTRSALRAMLAGDGLTARRLERDESVVDPTDLFRVVDEFEGLELTLLELQARTRTMADARDLLARVKSDAFMIRWELVLGGFVAEATADEVGELLRILPPAEKTWGLRLLAADRLVALGLPDEARQAIDAVLRGTTSSGWADRYDGGSRTSALEALARIDRSAAAAQTWSLLAEDIAANRIGARVLLSVWDRVVPLLADDVPDVAVWDEIAPYVDALVAHADTLPGPVLPAYGDATDADAAEASFVTFAAQRLEHPALALAQAAQRFMVDLLLTGDRHAKRCIALALSDRGQSAESALVVLTAVATVDPKRVRFAASELRARASVPHYRERRMIADLRYALGDDNDSIGAGGGGMAPRPLPPPYLLHHPPAPPADGVGEPSPGEPLPGALHPIDLLRIIEPPRVSWRLG